MTGNSAAALQSARAACDAETLHIPGAVQPHGVLVVANAAGCITHVSDNAATLLQHGPPHWLGAEILELAEAAERDNLAAALQQAVRRADDPQHLQLPGGQWVDAIVHAISPQQRVVELEPRQAAVSGRGAYREARTAISRLRHAQDLPSLCAEAARSVRKLTGFDRVLVYRFDAEWNGRVTAEDCRDDITTYLNLHFPASDIPAPARALYSLNALRMIPNAAYTPARVLAAPGESSTPLDMSCCVLRSVSPHHIEYMRNMGLQASMSISLFRGDRLWGLISCGHESGPRYVPFAIRAACELVGEVMSTLIESKETNEDSDYRFTLKSVQTRLLHSMAQDADIVAGLTAHAPNMLEAAGAQGGAVLFNGELHLLGVTPTQAQVQALVQWITQQPPQAMWATHALPALYPAAARFKDSACGLLAMSMSRAQNNWLLWFRPEVTQTVHWGGNPGAFSQSGPAGPLHPRTSFELWKQVVHQQSLPWKEVEVQSAQELMRAIIDIMLQNSEELSQLNTELERSNVELDAFAYAASHDLKEPLRGIHNYATLVMRELGEAHLIGETLPRLQTVIRLTERMEDLINSLLHYAHVGRMELTLHAVNLNEVVGLSAEMLRSRFEETGTVLRVGSLPSMRGDKVLLGEVFSNLLGNAIKYNDKAARWVEVGVDSATPEPVFFVRDNGIGIRERNFQTVFNIFRRLHGRDKYGGGTGTGLTIAKRIIERHGGKIWVHSHYGEGTAFYFTLGDVQRHGN